MYLERPFKGRRVVYGRCRTCGHLTCESLPADEIYGNTEYFQDIDSGWQFRNDRMVKFISMLSRMPGIRLPRDMAVLDYGSGQGELVALLRHRGLRAYGYEPFFEAADPTSPIYQKLEDIKDVVDQFALITMIEVLEHLPAPREVLVSLKPILASNGYLMVSTGIYDPEQCTKDWDYINPDAGHISIFTAESLLALMRTQSFLPVLRINEKTWLFRYKGSQHRSVFEKLFFNLTSFRAKYIKRDIFRTPGLNPTG